MIALRHAGCNELLQARGFAAAAKSIRRAGYAGIEVAPFTLDADPASLSGSLRRLESILAGINS